MVASGARRVEQRRWRLPIASPLTPYDQDFRCFAGSQWFGASRAAASVLLSPAPNHLQLQRFLRDRWMLEETYFQTVLGNEASLVLHNERDPQADSRTVKDYLATLDEAAFGAPTRSSQSSSHRPTRQLNGPVLTRGRLCFAYADNYVIDVRCGVIMDVEASRAVR